MFLRRIYILLFAISLCLFTCQCSGSGSNRVEPINPIPDFPDNAIPGLCGKWGHSGSNPWKVSSDNNGTASVAYDDVIACIENATSGDTINVPAGASTWTSTVTIPVNKPINLVGAGSDINGTIITISGGGKISALSPNYSISYFRFLNERGDSNPTIDAKNIGWRIHHNYFGHVTPGYSTRGNTAFIVPTGANDGVIGRHPDGLIDSNTFADGRIVVYGESSSELMAQNALWLEDSSIGTKNAVYIENNIFSERLTGNVIDANNGGKYVFRFNTVTEGNYSDEAPIFIMSHSLQGATERSAKSWEVYNNSFTYNNDKSYALAFMRGGTGFIYNNYMTASRVTTYTIVVDNVRSNSCNACGTMNPDSALCNGSSNWDGNTSGQYGYPCRDQIGRGKDTGSDSSVIGKTTSSEPAYFFNNTRNTGANIAVLIVDTGYNIIHIQSNRDYYDYNASFNGIMGTGKGLKAAMPATCTTGVGYWATDETKFYNCIATNTWTNTYAPYRCPHPLTGLTGSCDYSIAGTDGYNR